MKKAVVLGLLLITLALNWAGTSPALAYYPPLQDVTTPTVTQDTETRVNVSVHNPATGQDIPGVWSTPGGAGVIAVDQITKNQGMVAWRVRNLTENKYLIICGVYDPNPEMGWQFFTGWGTWNNYETNIMALNDGVLHYKIQGVGGTVASPLYYIEEQVVTYDPGLEMPGEHWYVGWRSYGHSYSSYSENTTYAHFVKDGVLTYIYWDPSWEWILEYMVFDSRHHFWATQNQFPLNPTAPSINAATVTWNDDAGAQKRGYDNTDMSWKPAIDTKVMANFAFAPLAPRPNQPVYFTDMSIGANTWLWTGTDGGSSTNRSGYHSYAKPGQYLVSLDVTGPNGADTSSQTVPVQAGATGPLMLLLLDG